MKKRNTLLTIFTALAMAGSITVEAQNGLQSNPLPLKSVYNTPAQSWENQALPLGNGYMGSMIFGGVALDRIQVNEHTIWSGGPGKNPDYNGGHHPTRTAGQIRESLQNARQALQDKMTDFSKAKTAYIDNDGKLITNDYTAESPELKEYIQGTMGIRNDFGSFQTLGNIFIAETNKVDPDTITEQNSQAIRSDSYSDYQRSLDIDNAVSMVSYTQAGVTFTREYFMSYPKNVMAIKYSANKKGCLSRTVWINTAQPQVTISAENNTITMIGRPSDHNENGLKFAQQVRVVSTGGTVRAEGTKIIVEDADEFVVLMSAASNYVQCMDDTFNYFSSTDPLHNVQNNLEAAEMITYDELRSEHISDYKVLYDRMQLSLKDISSVPQKSTDELLKGYKNGENTVTENRYLELLYFQFGRYLLIVSSRPNTLPANLQGIWAQGLSNAWSSDYHTNINLQMNYWPAQQTNLSDCHLPMIEYVKSLIPRGQETAKMYYCTQDGKDVRGWVINHENNTWGNTAPSSWYTAFYFPTAAAWCCQDIWEYYQFNSDKEFLAQHYNMMLDAALFWVDNLWQDARDGKLVSNPAYSPEHGNFSIGTSADQAIITELFDFVIKASEALDKPSSEIEEIRAAKNKLSGPQIGLGGQFMEWRDEITLDITGDNHHRHVNHLHWLHPGSQIVAGQSDHDDKYIEAMKKTLNTRGDGGTGWSKAWKINFWARLRDGNRAHKLMQELLKESTLQNLFDTHPPFQIDGNFGATSGVAEMLIQSQGESIEILPALPQAWATGTVKGIKARGNFEVNIDWENMHPQHIEIKSNAGNICMLKYPQIAQAVVKDENGTKVKVTKINDNQISFPTTKNQTYTINSK